MTTPHPVDLAVVIALREEFRELRPIFGKQTPSHTPDLRAYAFERGGYRCVATFVGEMGGEAAAIVADRLITAWTPDAHVPCVLLPEEGGAGARFRACGKLPRRTTARARGGVPAGASWGRRHRSFCV